MNIPEINRLIKELTISANHALIHIEKTFYCGKHFSEDTLRSLIHSMTLNLNEINERMNND